MFHANRVNTATVVDPGTCTSLSMFKMMWACGLVLVLLLPQFPSIREINFSGNIDIDIENELLPKDSGKNCGKEDAVNLHRLGLSMIPTHVIKSDKVRHVDLSYNVISNIPNSFFLDVPNIECLNLTGNAYSPKSVFRGSNSYSLKTLVLDRSGSNGYNDYNRCKMTGYFPNLETLHLSNIEMECSIDASMEDKLPRLKTLYLMGYGSNSGSTLWRLPTTLRHLHLEGTRFNEFPLNAVSNLQSLYLDEFNYDNDFYIPSEMKNLQVLSCRNCSLRTSEIETFFDSPRNALRLLDLSQNSLYHLPANMFHHMSNLESLLLSNNEFSIMPDVQALSRLRGLVLSHNHISEVAGRRSDSLKTLSLQGNGISQINVTTFQGYPALEMLDLSENKLASLPIGWAHSLENLLALNLKSNSFVRLSDTSLTTANSELRHLLMSVHPIESFDEQDFELLPENCTIHFMLRDDTFTQDETVQNRPGY
ncbi:podocan-like protein 1 [Lasioglossum baleicum]|uniref:podocan-like protein 1 n=1 Tax=Lasioglossum baleicum TaxID=434251 RepID=UPI003FCD29B7